MKLSTTQQKAIRIILEEELLAGSSISPEEATEWIVEVCERPAEAARVVARRLSE